MCPSRTPRLPEASVASGLKSPKANRGHLQEMSRRGASVLMGLYQEKEEEEQKEWQETMDKAWEKEKR